MSQSFRWKFDQMRENNPGREQGAEDQAEFYPRESHARNICFALSDGRKTFLNYSYLVSGEYVPEENTITLVFTSHLVTLRGVNLEPLFMELMQHLPRIITCTESRYASLEEGKTLVTTIEIKASGE
jgi:hypothetical protein